MEDGNQQRQNAEQSGGNSDGEDISNQDQVEVPVMYAEDMLEVIENDTSPENG